MHAHEALEDGDSQQRVIMVSAWRESPVFSERERMAFEWTEAVTLISEKGVPGELYARALEPFSEQELVKLTVAVSMINTWNRLSISFHTIHPERAPNK